ncbi:hypothetical protein MASR2M74_05180 [Paracoccaceae bacterium]
MSEPRWRKIVTQVGDVLHEGGPFAEVPPAMGTTWQVSGGYGLRERPGEWRVIVPGAMKAGGLGTTPDIPFVRLSAADVRSRFDVIPMACEDGPRAGEELFALAMARGGRMHSRMGGLEPAQVRGEDGLR